MFGVGFVLDSHIDEESVVAIHIRRADWLPIDRDEALAVLSSRFGEELLGPGAEISQAR